MTPETVSTEQLTYQQINHDVLRATRPAARGYYYVIGALFLVAGVFFAVWAYQVRSGMGVTHLNHPVGWGAYIGNFVFWVGIAHSGTLISAILYLVRARWRDAVSRSAEAMTVFAVMTAGLFPLIHLGRLWVFYFILPYPSQRRIWPNFISPLVWDVMAVSTYFTVSVIFFYVGLIPDMAAARDRAMAEYGPRHWRTRLYRILAVGWSGATSQWQHYGRAYLFFAALATPLVISVHSVVSWDFAMGILPGWHSTIFAPYFVAGAIHSGLAMVLTLMIPMRRLLRLERLITPWHFDMVARTILVTTSIVGYAYIIEPAIAKYSHDLFEMQFSAWRATGYISPVYWALFPLNVLFPLLFAFGRVRRSLGALFAISIGINIGMWLERLMIVTASEAHDFLPHNWSSYWPNSIEFTITAGSFAFFLFLFLVYAKILPTVPLADLKERIVEREFGEVAEPKLADIPLACAAPRRTLAVYPNARMLVDAVKRVLQAGVKCVDAYTPVRVDALQQVIGRSKSPVRIWTLIGALTGLAGGFTLAIGTAEVNKLLVGAKPPVSIIPYCIIAFEGTILLGTLANLLGLIWHARLLRLRTGREYDPRFSSGKFGLLVEYDPVQSDKIHRLLIESRAEEIHGQT